MMLLDELLNLEKKNSTTYKELDDQIRTECPISSYFSAFSGTFMVLHHWVISMIEHN